MHRTSNKEWSLMFGLGVFIIVASGMGIFKTHGVVGEFFGTLIAGVIIVAITTVAFKGRSHA